MSQPPSSPTSAAGGFYAMLPPTDGMCMSCTIGEASGERECAECGCNLCAKGLSPNDAEKLGELLGCRKCRRFRAHKQCMEAAPRGAVGCDVCDPFIKPEKTDDEDADGPQVGSSSMAAQEAAEFPHREEKLAETEEPRPESSPLSANAITTKETAPPKDQPPAAPTGRHLFPSPQQSARRRTRQPRPRSPPQLPTLNAFFRTPPWISTPLLHAGSFGSAMASSLPQHQKSSESPSSSSAPLPPPDVLERLAGSGYGFDTRNRCFTHEAIESRLRSSASRRNRINAAESRRLGMNVGAQMEARQREIDAAVMAQLRPALDTFAEAERQTAIQQQQKQWETSRAKKEEDQRREAQRRDAKKKRHKSETRTGDADLPYAKYTPRNHLHIEDTTGRPPRAGKRRRIEEVGPTKKEEGVQPPSAAEAAPGVVPSADATGGLAARRKARMAENRRKLEELSQRL